MEEAIELTSAMINSLKNELEQLPEKIKSKISEMNSALEFQDLSENEEYHTSRKEVEKLKNRESEIKNILDRCVQVNSVSNKLIGTGSLVSLFEVQENGESKELGIFMVDSVGSMIIDGRISVSSPIYKVIFGNEPGEFYVKSPIDSNSTKYLVELLPETFMKSFESKFPVNREERILKLFSDE